MKAEIHECWRCEHAKYFHSIGFGFCKHPEIIGSYAGVSVRLANPTNGCPYFKRRKSLWHRLKEIFSHD